MNSTYSSDDKVVVVYSHDVGNLADFVFESPTGNFFRIADRTQSVRSFCDTVCRVWVYSESVYSLSVVVIAACSGYSKLVGLCIYAWECLLACKSLFIENSHFFLEYRSGSLGNFHYVCTILCLKNKWLVFSGCHNWLETRDHIGLGHPADVSFLAVSGRILVVWIESYEVGEVAAFLDNSLEAICFLVSIFALEKDVLYIYWVRNHLGIHDSCHVEVVTFLDNVGNIAFTIPYEVLYIRRNCVEFSFLEVDIIVRSVWVLHEERLHVGCSCELIVKFFNFLSFSSHVLCRWFYLIYNILDVAACVLLEELLVWIIVILYLTVRYDDGRILLVSERHHYEIHIWSNVVLSHSSLEHKRSHDIALVEQWRVLCEQFLIEDRALEIIPI